MTIMIIGSESEHHAKYIFDRLEKRGADCFYLDTRTFPQELRLNLTPKTFPGESSIKTPEGKRIPVESIRAIYWRYHHGIEVPKGVPRDVSHIVYREIESAVGSLFRNLTDVLWVNSWSAIERHRYKTHQLFLMAEAGIPIPETLVSNDPEEIVRFYEEQGKNVIYKPVSGGAHTSRLTDDDLTEQRLNDLRMSPVQFQEMIEGVDVRVYLIGDKLYAAEIQAGTLDFRDNPQAPIVKVDIPDDVAQQCRTVANLFEYRFTGIDIRRTPDNRYIFIEANPSPMFIHFERTTGYPISDSLMTLLEQGSA